MKAILRFVLSLLVYNPTGKPLTFEMVCTSLILDCSVTVLWHKLGVHVVGYLAAHVAMFQ